jgi:hypothetical protein
MSQRIYMFSYGSSGAREPRVDWVNQPVVPHTSNPIYRGDLPDGPIADRGNHARGVGSGFPPFPETPLFVFDRSIRSKSPKDIIAVMRELHLLSERAKAVFEPFAESGAALQFFNVETRQKDGAPGPLYWLADITLFLDALDEAASNATVTMCGGVKRVNLMSRNVFRRSDIGQHHIFRLMHSPGTVCCDETFRSALISVKPKLTGLDLVHRGDIHA